MTPKKSEIKAYGGFMIDRQTLNECCRELAQFGLVVERLLEEVESDYKRTSNFQIIAEKLVKIKGSARQMNLNTIADLAELAEELAIKGVSAEKGHVIKKVSGALWDAVTTLVHMLDQVSTDTSDEAKILMNRLEKAIESLGGPREKVNQDSVEELFK